MITAKIGRRGQLVLPREIRQRFQVNEGDRVAFLDRGDEIVLQPIRDSLLELRGSVPVTGKQDFTAVRKKTRTRKIQGRNA